jgi:AAA15 family ATPase/GTPase
MSAGEQKVFRLLEKVFKSPKHSLILIDELDLLLHDSAMKNLITVMSERAENQKLQIIFTTHRESVVELSGLINVRHIFGTKEKTLCFNETKPDAIRRLTGIQRKDIEVFVEDDR